MQNEMSKRKGKSTKKILYIFDIRRFYSFQLLLLCVFFSIWFLFAFCVERMKKIVTSTFLVLGCLSLIHFAVRIQQTNTIYVLNPIQFIHGQRRTENRCLFFFLFSLSFNILFYFLYCVLLVLNLMLSLSCVCGICYVVIV